MVQFADISPEPDRRNPPLPIRANPFGSNRTQFKCVAGNLSPGKYKIGAEVSNMLWTLFVVLLVLWLLGVVSSYTLGGFIHILLVLAVVALVFQLISGRRTVV